MKRNLAVILTLAIVFLGFSSLSIAAKKTGTGKKSLEEDVTISAIITGIDLVTNTVTLRDETGKQWEFVVPTQSGINLSNYKVNETVTLTAVIDAVTQNTVLKSFIRKR